MRYFGIKGKLFTVILLTFTLLIGIILVGSAYYFEPYYRSKKIKNLEEQMVVFKDQNLGSKTYDKELLLDRMKAFSDQHSSPLVVETPDSELLYPTDNFIATLDSDGQSLLVDLYYPIVDMLDKGVKLNTGLDIGFRGFWENDKFIAIYLSELDGKKLESDEEIDQLEEWQDLETVRGKIVSYDMPKYDSGYIYRQETLLYLIDKYEKNSEKVILYTDNATGIDNYLVKISHGKFTVYSIFTTQPINELLSFMPEFMKYVIIVAVFLNFIISLVITKLIVRPILEIRNTSSKMANLDFSERILIKSKDEIGMLSEDFNLMADRLESTIQEIEYSNRMLLSELEKEKQLEQARKNFVADASHELRTPLSIIQAYGERIVDKYHFDDKFDKYMAVILEEQRKMNKLIDDLLELSKLESLTYKMSLDQYDINEDILEVIDRLFAIFEDKNLKLHCNLADKGTITADREKMSQVLMNVISNAFKYTPDSQNIWIETVNCGELLKVSISNEVENIDSIDLEKLYDRFYKSDKSRSRKMGGTGLGLAITRMILNLHGMEFGFKKSENRIEFYFVYDFFETQTVAPLV